MVGGEVFIPKIPSMRVTDLAEAMAPGVPVEVDRHPARREAARGADHRRREPPRDRRRRRLRRAARAPVVDRRTRAGSTASRSTTGFVYASDTNDGWLDRATSSVADAAVIPYGHQSIDDDDIAAVVAVLQGRLADAGPGRRGVRGRARRARSARRSRGRLRQRHRRAPRRACAAAGLGPGDAVGHLAALVRGERRLRAATSGADARAARHRPDDAEPRSRRRCPTASTRSWPCTTPGCRSTSTQLAPPPARRHRGRRPRPRRHDTRRAGRQLRPQRHVLLLVPPGEADHHRRGRRGHHQRRRARRAAARFRNHGIDAATPSTGGWYYEIDELGFNYRLTDMQAALGTSQLRKLDRFVDRRNAAGRPLPRPTRRPGRRAAARRRRRATRHGYHLFPVRVAEPPPRLRRAPRRGDRRAGPLRADPPPSRVRRLGFGPSTSRTPSGLRGLLSLPLYPDLVDADQDR